MAERQVAVVIVAAGTGTRAGEVGEAPKQYRRLAGRSLLAHTLDVFLAHPAIDRIVTVIHPDHGDLYAAAIADLAAAARLGPAVTGGASRQISVARGLEALAADPPDLVLVHDAARPFVTAAVIDRAIAALAEVEGALVAVPVVDTLKHADAAGHILATRPRNDLHAAQTPQGFRYPALLAAHRRAAAEGQDAFTDDAAVAEWAGLAVRVVTGDPANVKVTTAEDLIEAERRLDRDRFARAADVRVGTGYDVHALVPGDFVTLCGVRIDHDARLDGHSDADVALHALTDAILGALGDGDIGAHFPPSEMRWRGCDSAVFLADALARMAARGGFLAHADVTLIAEAPKIGPHREAMRTRLAQLCGVALDRVAVKATTNEKLGFVGRREGIAAIATATVRLPLP
ncbi:bifunctional 2-C-methyl-D-erythritol 4-phosphate cytidylyltransferase/2-C-methyl-D-erythritol 2,4-cyclodiphosphate synthase [Siculibacillus lacustris]|uniref:Bifunctional enzyme IspD/IspF n=1 Tax=Siculibacillus lacustris TaxID=1549641 RepID=A0A4Q9VN38_9HYPH|nr:bifunctional 2-C-methyl-D-erythritol 4-phosphate cytidylyltransferase/2-C-methyl-D-erythritol 2,4-cyclodiphosphate synthase [Siculibacillus lacustris]TBW37029.1 bifunctional 2-C-methyl-D-erythritol 4-phosphate cytidylyltransferase/2-C-methyl-D-erythritol 2,4-cyclodiphosphate synthase [Siculibacillus lacustris]